MTDEKEQEEEGTPIKMDFGLGGLLDSLTNFAGSTSGNEDAKQRVAEIKRRLGDLSGEKKGAGGGGIGGDIFGAVGKIVEMAGKLQTVGGEGGVREFTMPSGGKGVISFGGNIGSARNMVDGAGSEESDFKPEPVVSPSPTSRKATTVVAPPVKEPAETEFNLEVTEISESVLVFGTVPAVEHKSQISCKVAEDGMKLVVTVKDTVHEVELPAQVETEQTTASYTNGLFSVTLKKVENDLHKV
ncbi:MAG: hypothetical protein HQ539_00805 [Parcubacteria group bacterium]|nr:hypothetical protein [Parcubacteria group bacterium]